MPVISYDRLDSLGDVVGIEQVTLEMEFDGAEETRRSTRPYAQQSYQKQRYRSCRQARLLSRQDSTSRSLQVVDFTLDLRDPDQLEVLLGFQVFNFGSRLLDCGSEVVVRGLNRG
jgi:hypothetical protein